MMHVLRSRLPVRVCFTVFILVLSVAVPCQSAAVEGDGIEPARMQLSAAYACEDIVASRPLGRSVVFSAAQGTVYCFTEFSHIAEPGQIIHRWLYRDREVARIALAVQPPRWATYSRVRISPDRIGPWRVEVLDRNGTLYGVVRFSVVQ